MRQLRFPLAAEEGGRTHRDGCFFLLCFCFIFLLGDLLPPRGCKPKLKIWIKCILFLDFPGDSVDKRIHLQCRRCRRCRFDPWVRKIPWRRKWQPTPVFLPGTFHGQRSLACYSPWGPKDWTQLSS